MTKNITETFTILRADANDISVFSHILQTVWSNMEHQDWFAIDDDVYITRMLTTKEGLCYKAIETATGAVAGLFMVALPGLGEANLGHDIGFTEEQLLQTAIMDSAAILPEYRGHHLQYRLMQTAEADLKDMGYRYLTVTVHPDNHSSHNTITRQGYRFIRQKEKYGGLLRDILLKEL